ncbi:methionyl-tRNA formyltransferase [Candidatus Nomurabacteria bacterium]|nr:methionyl-tRNA formyltransferase [Candidatus Nomurabacteria bacterium]
MSDNKLNFAFWGTPDVASGTLEMLKQAGFLPSLIVTSPDKPQGRKMIIAPPPVKVWAIENNIPYIQPEKLDEELTLKLSTFNFQLFIVVAYGKIMPENILNLPKMGSINVHYSLLPKYRGASPVESAILNGEAETGVTIQKMEFKMDSGPVVAEEVTEILPDEKAPDLRKRLIKIGGELLVKTLTPSASGISPFTGGEKQDESKATFCKKIKKEDGLIDLHDDAVKNYNKFRAYAAWPRTFFFQNDKRIIITDAVLQNNQFVIKKVLPEGKKEIKYEDFLKTRTSK